MVVQQPVLNGFYVFIEDPIDRFFQARDPEPFNYRTGDSVTAEFSTVAAGAQSGFKAISNLEPDNNPPHLFWVVPGVEDTEVLYHIKIPTGTDRLGVDVDKTVGFIDAIRSPFYDPDPRYAFWLITNFFPAINAVNNSNLTRTPRVWFEGYKYNIDEIGNPKKPETQTDANLRSILNRLTTGALPSTRINLGGVTAFSASTKRLF